MVARSQGEGCKQRASLIPKLFIFPPVRRAKICIMQKTSAVITLNFSWCTKETALGKSCKQSSHTLREECLHQSGINNSTLRLLSYRLNLCLSMTSLVETVQGWIMERSINQAQVFEILHNFLHLFICSLIQGNLHYLQKQNTVCFQCLFTLYTGSRQKGVQELKPPHQQLDLHYICMSLFHTTLGRKWR